MTNRLQRLEDKGLLDAALTAQEQAQLAALLSRFPERSGDAAVDQ